MRMSAQHSAFVTVFTALLALSEAAHSSRVAAGRETRGRLPSNQLTEFGRTIKTIVIAGASGDVCDLEMPFDWRTSLPQTLGELTGAHVITYTHRHTAFPDHHHCRYCWQPEHERMEEACEAKLDQGVDLLILVGVGTRRGDACATGTDSCPAIYQAMTNVMMNPWAAKARRTVHIPISNTRMIVENAVFFFDVILKDEEFAKPATGETAHHLKGCDHAQKRDEFLYVGRAKHDKGQAYFLERVDSKDMEGYSVGFFGMDRKGSPESFPGETEKYIGRVKSLAFEKNISASYPGTVRKEELFSAMCRAKGLILLSRDKNPRVVYEALQAGLPVLVASSAHVNAEVAEQDFIVEIHSDMPPASVTAEISRFIGLTRQEPWTVITNWVDKHLSDRQVYMGVCQQLGLCKAVNHEYKPFFGDAPVKPPPEQRKAFSLLALRRHAPLYPDDNNSQEIARNRREQRVLSPMYLQGIHDFYSGKHPPQHHHDNPLTNKREDSGL